MVTNKNQAFHKVAGLECMKCGKNYGPTEVEYTCPKCGLEGILEVHYDDQKMAAALQKSPLDKNRDPGYFRYEPFLPVSRPEIPLPVMNQSPLYRFLEGGNEIYIKDDSRQPTCSFKDRASMVGVALAHFKGVEAIVAASTGNAACSLSGFTASLPIKAIIFVPHTAPKAKLVQLKVFGARILAVEGNYDQAFELCAKVAESRGLYSRSCAYNPYLVEGKKTVAFEIFEQLGNYVPDIVFVPVGDGCILSGVFKGFDDLRRMKLTDRVPKIIAVQAEGSSSLIRALSGDGVIRPMIANTIADSICVGTPRNGRKALRALKKSNGEGLTVSDRQIQQAILNIARRVGVFSEPAGSTAFAGYSKLAPTLEGKKLKIVCLVTGNGLKDITAPEPLLPEVERVSPDFGTFFSQVNL